MYDFDKLLNRVGTNSSKWDGAIKRTGNPDILPMPVADMDFYIVPEISEAIIKRAQHPNFGYSMQNPDLFPAFIDWCRTRHGVEYRPEHITTCCGVVTGVYFALNAVTDPGDKVLTMNPVYSPFFEVTDASKRIGVETNLVNVNNRYEIDFADFEAKAADGCKALILCSPHIPIGRVWTREELEKILAICMKYGIYVIADEIHHDFAYPGHKHIPFLSICRTEEEREHVIAVTAPSKTFNVAGLNCSFICTMSDELIKKVKEFKESVFGTDPSMLDQAAATAAYRHGARWADEMIEYIAGNFRIIKEFLAAELPHVTAAECEGTFLTILDFSWYGLSQQELNEKFIEAGVQIFNADIFKPEHSGYFRINFGTQRSLLREGLNRIKKACDGIKK